MDEDTDNDLEGFSLSKYEWLRHVTKHSVVVMATLYVAASQPALAANNTTSMGTVYCGTAVESGIDLVFGALIGLGLPATLFYLFSSGISYMQAGSDYEQRRGAKEKLIMSGIGLGIIILAIVAPELISKIGSQIGFGFSDCVKPF